MKSLPEKLFSIVVFVYVQKVLKQPYSPRYKFRGLTQYLLLLVLLSLLLFILFVIVLKASGSVYSLFIAATFISKSGTTHDV